MARAPWSDYLFDDAGNVLAADQYEIYIYEDETNTQATLYLASAGVDVLAQPRRGNPGIQAKLTVQALPADTSITVDSTTGFAGGDVISLRSGVNQVYIAIKTVTDATHLALAVAVGGAFTYPVNTVVNGVHQTGHWRVYLDDVRNYTYSYKNTATGIESARRFINVKQPATTIDLQEEGSTVSTRGKINYVSPFVTVTDDAGNARANVTGPTAGVAPTTSAVGDAAAEGANTTVARSDHRHGREAFATNAIALGTAAAAGAATTLMRRDDTIAAFDATNPSTQAFGDAPAVGVINFAARRDHKHGMPARLVAVKTADESVNNSAALQNDDHLSVALAAGVKYKIKLFLELVDTVNGGFKFDWTIPSGLTGHLAGHIWRESDTTAVTNKNDIVQVTLTTALGATTGGWFGGNPGVLWLDGFVIAPNAGTLQFRWAQNTATVGNTTLKTGSYLVAEPLA